MMKAYRKWHSTLIAEIIICLGLVLAVVHQGPASADTVLPHQQYIDGWSWKMSSFEGSKKLEVFSSKSDEEPPVFTADVSNCTFCEGDDDSCDEDGIDIIKSPTWRLPYIQIVCHVGAHSQRLMIYDPNQDLQNPVFERTGAYWLQASSHENGINVTYDKSGFGLSCPDAKPSSDGFCEILETWHLPD